MWYPQIVGGTTIRTGWAHQPTNGHTKKKRNSGTNGVVTNHCEHHCYPRNGCSPLPRRLNCAHWGQVRPACRCRCTGSHMVVQVDQRTISHDMLSSAAYHPLSPGFIWLLLIRPNTSYVIIWLQSYFVARCRRTSQPGEGSSEGGNNVINQWWSLYGF